MKKVILLVIAVLLFGCIYQDHLPAKDISNITISVEPVENQIIVSAESNTTNTSKPGMEFTINRTSVFKDSVQDKNYTLYEIENSTHLSIQLSPAIPESWCLTESSYTDPKKWCPTDAWYRSDRHRISMNISGEEWVIAGLNSTILVLGKEKENVRTAQYFCNNSAIFNVSGKELVYGGRMIKTDESFAFIYEISGNDSYGKERIIAVGRPEKIENEYLHVWEVPACSAYCNEAHISVFSDMIEINSRYLEFEDSNKTALKSITIPKNTETYTKLKGKGFFGILNHGQNASLDDLIFQFGDITIGDVNGAFFAILDSNNSIQKTFTAPEGNVTEVKLNNKTYLIYPHKVRGYAWGTYWTEISIREEFG